MVGSGWVGEVSTQFHIWWSGFACLDQRLEGDEGQASGKVFKVEGMASEKSLREEYSWFMRGTKKSPV